MGIFLYCNFYQVHVVLVFIAQSFFIRLEKDIPDYFFFFFLCALKIIIFLVQYFFYGMTINKLEFLTTE